ncbi:class I SAM-dependent methyltransferase [Schlesneria sp.]|uniref:class I SAM-dependent methyltransferase n=1 Tax=Schlesneria sp. TaxID=2762018 RepID=UPI002EF38543
MKLLSTLLRRFVKSGTLRVYDAEGKLHTFTGTPAEPVVTMRLHNKSLYTKLFFNPELYVGEAYMDGELTFEEGSRVFDQLNLFSNNRTGLTSHPVQSVLRHTWRSLRRFHQHNPISRSLKNASHHYDLSDEFYRLFLDEDMQYTCAYYLDPNDTLEEAQLNKKRHVCAKLQIKDGMKIAELGCGWGGLALYMAQIADVEVTAVNLSIEQIRVARQRAEALGVADRVHFEHMDYRQLQGKYDRVVSVGMLEHVGVGHYDEFFRKFRSLLNEDGLGLVHSIGRNAPPGTVSPFVRKYIFPGGYAPSLSEIFAPAERQRIWVADCEILRLHYYYTLRDWRDRFMANWDKAAAIYDERMCRMWEFYLISAQLAFLTGSEMIFQLILANKRDAVPIVRDYIVDNERAARNTA